MTAMQIGVVGLGYVGLPLAIEFGKRFATVGYDHSKEKIEDYRRLHDPSGEVTEKQLRAASHLELTSDPARLRLADFVIVAVPTPVDEARRPDFGPMVSACRAIGPHLKQGGTVVFESTVYPGATEAICVPALEESSGKRWKRDFFIGYSPERINPGDEEHTLTRVVKVVAGDTPDTLARVAALYEQVVTAGVHRASSIRVAEAAKVIENTQRDLNIALMNELALIFHRLGIDTKEVLDAAGTKWNFLRFTPGLVGGHCIGVDPYYLTHAAERAGHHPEVILAGRRINDSMGTYIAQQTVKCLVDQGHPVNGSTINILGLAFKENCADLRNSKVVDLIGELEAFGARVFVHDPRVSPGDARREYGIRLDTWESLPKAHALVLAVPHSEFRALAMDVLVTKVAPSGCVIDVRSALDPGQIESRGLRIWRL